MIVNKHFYTFQVEVVGLKNQFSLLQTEIAAKDTKQQDIMEVEEFIEYFPEEIDADYSNCSTEELTFEQHKLRTVQNDESSDCSNTKVGFKKYFILDKLRRKVHQCNITVFFTDTFQK